MKSLLALPFSLAAMLAQPALAQNDERPVPIERAPFHLPVITNEYVTLFDVYIPPGRTGGYHIHTGDSVSVNIENADMSNQDLGEPQPGPPHRGKPGSVSYADYRTEPKTHKATNVGATPFHNIFFKFRNPQPGGFVPSSRVDVPGYMQVLDNARVRGWRLVVGPGQSAAAITQTAPGLRIVVAGGDIVESVPGQPDRSMWLRTGTFFWQDAGATRAVRNAGAARVELVEFELK
jgi:hypothetical protein